MSRRRIEQLRALARSTTFPEEAKSANAKADALEAKLDKEEVDLEAMRKLHGLGGPWPSAPPKREKRPWRGSPGEHDELYAEALASALAELEKDKGLRPRLREILARKMALEEMMRRFDMD